MSIPQKCLEFADLFEAELLVELMLRYWHHPLADDANYRSQLLESACGALESSIDGHHIVDGLKPENVNLIAAVWYAEANTLGSSSIAELEHVKARMEWLEIVQRCLPSCFCDPDLLE